MANTKQKFKVTVGDKAFYLSKPQIYFDSPNYFTSCFVDGPDDEIELSRDPVLFQLIVDYLNGYCVLPLRPDRLPPKTPPETVLANLRVDAEFYQLHGLLDLLDSPPVHMSLDYRKQRMFTQYLMITHSGKGKIEEIPAKNYHVLLVEKRQFDEWFRKENRFTDRTHKGQLVIASQVRDVAAKVLQHASNRIEEWELLGWSREGNDPGPFLRTIMVQVWSLTEVSMKL
ncbi:hypothetical protein RhiJN_25152 [Ceratobasidium sp. AG-Ba]|nr:hypothetical protein RhiJN_10962 [Ceratobasidium sp. AG-Ba]QRV97133.1 hypothetical protein RhiJN_25152 [Ceratobasidium sp. AG-Ba]QRW11697.1 hypothetical protein RhiLY_10696 [Ceratobasidium sp. AG-Ba]